MRRAYVQPRFETWYGQKHAKGGILPSAQWLAWSLASPLIAEYAKGGCDVPQNRGFTEKSTRVTAGA